MLIKLADRIFGGKTSAKPDLGGTVKFPFVQQTVTSLESGLVSLGKGTATTAPTIQGAIQGAFNQLALKGELVGHETVLSHVPELVGTSGFQLSSDGRLVLDIILGLVKR